MIQYLFDFSKNTVIKFPILGTGSLGTEAL